MHKLVRSVGVLSAAVAFGAGSALVAPMAGAQSSLPGSSAPEDCAVTNVVTPSGLEAAGWGTPDDETDAEIAAVTGAPAEVGAAALTLPTAEGGSSLYKDADRMELSELLGEDGELRMNFDYTSAGQAPALQIRLHEANLADSEDNAAGSDLGFATIVWSPEAAEGDWEKADPADSDQFWVTRALDGGEEDDVPRDTRMTLEQIIDLNPDAVVTDYGVQKTRDNTAANVAIDNFTFGCETTNFELDPEDADEDEDGGSLGNIFGSVSGIFQS